jgi:hypothetical protein
VLRKDARYGREGNEMRLAVVTLAAVLAVGGAIAGTASAAPAPNNQRSTSTSASTTDAALIHNGDFESGNLDGFVADGVNDGYVTVVEEGTCFSYYDTRGISFSGRFATAIGSGNSAPIDSIGILTSAPFTAGEFISFDALSESVPGIVDPVDLEVVILTADGAVLATERVTANVLVMSSACGLGPQDAAFSQHAVDTSAFEGASIKVQFRQHTNYALNGYFTLLDNIRTSPPSDLCAAAAETTLTSCSFEVPVLGDGNFSYETLGSAWTFRGSAGIASNNSGFTGEQRAPRGQQVAFLQGGGSQVEQSISGFVSERRYTLTLSAAQRGDNQQDFAVLLDQALLGAFKPGSSNYADIAVSFTTTTGTHTLQFLGLDTVGGDHTVFVDDLRLVSVPSQPEVAPRTSRNETIFAASCPGSRPDVFSVSAVFFASDAPRAGTTSAFHVLGSTQVIIVYTAGTTRLAMQEDSFCYFIYQSGPLPPAPFDGLFGAWALIVPQRR